MFATNCHKKIDGRAAPRSVCRGALMVLVASSLAGPALERPAFAIGNQEPAGLNLGLTSFYDGFGRNEAGFVYIGYLSYSEARQVNGNDGTALKVPAGVPGIGGNSTFNNPSINSFLFLNQLVYVAPDELFGGWAHFGFDFLLPIVGFATSFDGAPPPPGTQLQDNGTALGDLVVGPLLQFKPIMSDGRPIFSGRVEFDVIAPTGAYDPNKDINQGSNFASLNPYVAFTVLPIRGLEISSRLHYLYNFVNRRPAYSAESLPPMAPVPVSAQSGQAFWANFTVSYEILHGLHLGVNGYYFKQFTDDQFTYGAAAPNDNGQAVGDSGQAEFLTLGPGVFWDIAKEHKLFANAYFALETDNRPVTNQFLVHYIHSF